MLVMYNYAYLYPPLVIYGFIYYWLIKLCYNLFVINMDNLIINRWTQSDVETLNKYFTNKNIKFSFVGSGAVNYKKSFK